MSARALLCGGAALLALAGTADAAKLSDASRAEIVKMLNLVADTYPEVGGTRFGELAQGQVIDIPFTGDQTVEYYINVICDDDCVNVDLAALAADGTGLDTDDADDNAPVLNLKAAVYRSPLDKPHGPEWPMTIQVRMKACKAETCGYGLRITQVDDWK